MVYRGMIRSTGKCISPAGALYSPVSACVSLTCTSMVYQGMGRLTVYLHEHGAAALLGEGPRRGDVELVHFAAAHTDRHLPAVRALAHRAHVRRAAAGRRVAHLPPSDQ
eukprot:1190715-Prorocentrum_minimum.AAC.3